MTEKEKIKPKIKKKRKPYDLAEEIKELANWEETGYKILVEIISGFKYAVKIKIDPSLIDEKLVQLIDKDEDIVFILLIKYNHPYVAPFLLCLTKFSVPELSDGRDLIEEVLNSPWPIKEKKMLKKVIKLIPGFINNYLKNVTVEKNIKITGKYYLDSTYELNILNLIPHLFFGDIFEIVALGNDKRVFDDKRILMITEGFILLFVEKSVFEIQKLKLIFWGPIDSLSIIKQINGRNVIELKWKAKKDKTTLMRLKTDKSQQIFDILMESLNKKKIEYKIANESSGAKKGEIPKIDIVAVEQEISKLEIKIKLKGKDGSNMDNTVQLMNLYEKAVQYYSALNDYRYQIYMRKTKKLFTNMSDKDLGFNKLNEEKKVKKEEKKKKGKKGKKKKNKEDKKEEKDKDKNKEENKVEVNNNEKESEENNINNDIKDIKEDKKEINDDKKADLKEKENQNEKIKQINNIKEEKKEDKKEEKKEEIKEDKKEIKKEEKKEDRKEMKKEEKKEVKKETPKKVEKSDVKQKFEKSGFNLDLDDDDE